MIDTHWRALQDDPLLVLHATIYAWSAELFEPGWVLDVGCEFGHGSALLSEVNPNLRVLGCDTNFQTLIFAKELITNPAVSFHQANASTLPLPDKSLSGICLFNLLHLVSNPVATLQEACRVLRDHQQMVVSLPLDDNLPAEWREGSPADRLTELLVSIFESVIFPDQIAINSSILPSRRYRLGLQAPLLLAVCHNDP